MGRKVRVAIIGVGNCASSLVQGVECYKEAKDDEFIPGLMHPTLGGLHISDIEFSAAFDIAKDKVGKDLSEAILAYPNNTIKFADVPHLDVPVHRGMTHDGLGKYLSQMIEKAEGVNLYTPEGKKIIDCISSWWVNIHGHSPPKIAQAVAEQAATLPDKRTPEGGKEWGRP